MTPRERAQAISDTSEWAGHGAISFEARLLIEQAINAAVEEKEARIAELESILTHSRQCDQDAWLGRKIKAAVEEEREECAKIAEGTGPKFYHKDMREAANSIATEIRARCNTEEK